MQTSYELFPCGYAGKNILNLSLCLIDCLDNLSSLMKMIAESEQVLFFSILEPLPV